MFFLKILGLVWSLPNTLIGVLLLLPYWPKKIRFRNWGVDFVATRIMFSPGAQTWGVFEFYSSRFTFERGDLHVHEDVHKRDAMVLGPLFLVAYAVAGLVAQMKARTLRGWKAHWYDENWFEVRARRAQHAWHNAQVQRNLETA